MGLTHALGKKIPNFSLFRFGQIPVFSYFFAFKTGLEIMFINVLDRKESCFCVKKFNISKSQKSLFWKQVNACFLLKNANAWVNPFGKM